MTIAIDDTRAWARTAAPATATASRRRDRIALIACAVLASLAILPAASQAAACDAPVTNPVACENTLAGTNPATWQIDGAGDPSIQGYATAMSVNKGSTVSFKIKSATTNYRINVYRLGYYGGQGARLVASGLTPTGPATQPACQTFSDSGLVDCGNWSVSRSWTVPSTAVSGVYIAHLIRNDTGGASHITFVVRDEASTSDVVVQTSDATWQAYNTYGGNSTYVCAVACPPGNPSTYKSAYKVSYNRPSTVAEDDGGRSALFTGGEYSMIRFLEAGGYDVSYLSQIDTEARGELLLNHRLFISSGHDEYWSQNQRDSMEAARAAGVNLAFFSGNTGFWKTRFEPSADGTSTADRTLVSYKDTHFEAQQDPVEWTGTWRDPRFTVPPNRPVPENALLGLSFLVNFGTSAIRVPSEYKRLRLWRNTAAAALADGTSLTLAPSTLGYEWDVDADNGFRPPGTFRLSATTVSGLETFTDYGSTVTGRTSTATHNMVSYRAPSGALVFNSGTVQWSWGLDDYVDLGTKNATMRQATVNLFADMGAQPYALPAGLVPATQSTDTTKPTSTITNPPTTVADGTRVTLAGTATDAGGGVVGGVEVSTDGGSTWHPATTGTANWTYTWIAHGSPTTTIRTRATDDSGNLEVPGAGAAVTVTCPCSLWGDNVTPPVADSGDPNPAELGMKFTSDTYGTISGVRFFKAAANTGTHTGSLWTAGGTRLAQATFTNETASGWQTATFSSPVQVQPNTTYIVSYHAPNGRFAATPAYFYPSPAPGPNGGAMADSPPLHATRNSGTTANGLFAYSGTSTFPASSFGASNYWVDAVFSPTPAPGQATGVTATPGGRTSANVTWSAPASGGSPTTYTVTPRIGGVAQTPKAVNGTPPLTTTTMTGLTTGTTYTFTVTASSPAGSGPESAASNPVTPISAVVPAAPTGVDARPATQRARVTWTPPGSDGDSPLTGYTITPFLGGTAQPGTQVGPSVTSATVTGLTNGSSYSFRVRATNAVGDSPSSAPSNAVTPQSTILDFATPPTIDTNDGNAVELGVKFMPELSGTVTGVRFYKSAANTGTHTGSLWTTTGTRLAQATFTNETASGWQTVTFASPVAVTAGTTYVASYHAPSGHYSSEGGGINNAIVNGPLRAVANASSANGLYMYSASSSYPANSYNASNYFVDVLFALPVPGQVTGVTAAEAGRTSASVSWSAPTAGGPAMSYVVTPRINGVAQAPRTITGSPPATSTTVSGLTTGTTYTFTVEAANPNGSGPGSAPSNPVTPQTAVAPTAPTNVDARAATASARVSWSVPGGDGDSPITGYSVTPYIGSAAQPPTTVGASATSVTVGGLTNGTSYSFRVAASNAIGASALSAPSSAVTPRATLFDFATPAIPDAGDGNAVNLGVKFSASAAGSITGVRFYKAALNTGTHIGSLWSAGGALLAQATFTGESASGWQTVRFASPVAVTAGTTYVAGYHAPNGHYSASPQALSSAIVNGPLTAPSNTASGGNGVFSYGAGAALPTNAYNATSYSVDVTYADPPVPGQATDVTATAQQQAATVSWTSPSSGGAPTSYTVTPRVAGVAQTPKTVSGSPPATGTTVTGLTAGTSYTFTVAAANAGGSGAESAASNTVVPTGAEAPSAPGGVSAAADTKSATVSWNAPADDGGSPITGYTVTPFTGTTAGTTTTVGGSTTSTRITGLTNGTSYTFVVRAANSVGDSPPSAASGAVSPKHSIFDFGTPGTVDAGDGSSVNLGVKFTSDSGGVATGIRFYKAAANTGTHVGSLWSATGTLLAQVAFAQESSSGWQTARFASPVTITADTVYVASYLAPNGHYSVSGSAFSPVGIDNPPLRTLADPFSPNGVYRYGAASAFPTSSYNATNYWVDVLFGATGS